MKAIMILALSTMIFSIFASAPAPDKKQDAKPAAAAAPAAPKEVTMSDIPGITTPDKTPNACVNCHANHPEMKMDFRLTTTLAKWHLSGADKEILAKAQAAAPAGKVLTGKHPDVKDLVKVIPDDCLMCHNRESWTAPPFSRMLHAIHLVGGKDNHFLTMIHGTCTNCHKLDEKTGTWRVGSGEEKQ